MHDIVVIGAGISGLLSALALSDAGLRVLVLEQGEPGSESSWAGAGILSPLYPWRYPDAVNRLAAIGQAEYPVLCSRLLDETGIDPEREPSGMLILDAGESVIAGDWAGSAGVELRQLNDAQLRDYDPSLTGSAERALCLPEVAQVRNPRLLKAIIVLLQKRGVEIRGHSRVSGFSGHQGRLHGVRTEQGEIATAQALVAGGAWTAELLAELSWVPAVAPVRGQILLLKTEPGSLRRILLCGGMYLVPRRDGRVLVGSTLEHVGFDKSTTDTARQRLLHAAVSLYPSLVDAAVARHWAGLRPGSPNGIPYIGEHPELVGLYVNAGQYRNGVVLAPGSARLAADLVLGREPRVPAEDYSLERARPPQEPAYPTGNSLIS